MNDTRTTFLTSAELSEILRQTDPSALLVPPRILRRVIKQDRKLAGLGLQVPHRKSYVIGRDALLRIASRDELDVAADRVLPDILLLFPRPDAEKLERRGREQTLLKYWRLLFHARVHRALEQHLTAGKLTQEAVAERIAAIGRIEFDEARAVLRQENFLLPHAGRGETFTEYEEFAALFLELMYFAPELLAAYFPAILNADAVRAVLAQDVDATELFTATRLPGAADPLRRRTWESSSGPQPQVPEEPARDEEARELLETAVSATALGNIVRSAISRTRAGADANADLDALAHRLKRALGLSNDQAAVWRSALVPLLALAGRGIWPVEARFLYDLQKVCVDQERDIFAVDLIEWIVSWGRRPIFRLLPYQKDLLTVKHLRRALHKLTAVRLQDEERLRLARLVYTALQQAEHHLRDLLRPAIVGVLDQVGLTPGDVAESVSRDKLVEELLDRSIEQSFLTMGDLRDAIARNRVKLPDMVDPVTFLLGDQLVRANRGMAAALDGIFRRGEIYLRWLQRFSSLAFGNPVGRFLTRYIVLPFGSSFMALKAWEELEELTKKALGLKVPGEHHAAKHAHGVNLYVWLGLGVFLLLLFHVPAFRRGVWADLKLAWKGTTNVLVELPRAFLRLEWVQRVLQSRAYILVVQVVIKPLPWAALAWACLHLADAPPGASLGVAVTVFVLAGGLLNSRWGLVLEEATTDWLVRTWLLIHSDLIPGLVRWILYFFRRLVDVIDRFLYTVDEWLRFRRGDNRLLLFIKPVLGLIWFLFAYTVRIVINLFVEPTFNPIKHFPVVTVTAKLLLPFYWELRDLFAGPLVPILGVTAGRLVALGMVFLLPGLGGFLVWELTANWRLYRANQSPTLDTEIVGHHGETVVRLMRPGFHSGTLPKLYAKLRRAKGRSARRQREALHGVSERLRQFVQRDLLAILQTSITWAGAPTLEVGKIRLATNRIRMEVRAVGGESLFVELYERAGWLLAATDLPADGNTWLKALTPEQLLTFRDALAGFYEFAGVAVVREQVIATLPPEFAWEVTEEGLVVWPKAGNQPRILYPLSQGPTFNLPPEVPEPRALLFIATPVWWEDWVRTWELDHDSEGHPPLLSEEVRLLGSPEGVIANSQRA
jgi:hypothetical protein